jgi:hypothetical protein
MVEEVSKPGARRARRVAVIMAGLTAGTVTGLGALAATAVTARELPSTPGARAATTTTATETTTATNDHVFLADSSGPAGGSSGSPWWWWYSA